MNIYEKLELLQQEYKAPKNNYNSHGGFKYRSLESMLETLKPMLKKHKVILVFNDKLENCADTPHIVVHAKLVNLEDTNESIEVTATAQEAAIQKGMQAAQISGSTSSYARKYALAALLLVDESEELDSKEVPEIDFKTEISKAKTVQKLMELYDSMDESEQKQYKTQLSERREIVAGKK